MKSFLEKARSKEVDVPVVASDVVVIMGDDGIVKRYDSATGKEIDEAKLQMFPVELFDKEKASVLFYQIATGVDFTEALEQSKISPKSFVHWRKTNVDFSNLIDKARDMRSEFIHEKFLSEERDTLLSSVAGVVSKMVAGGMNEKDAINYTNKLYKAIDKKQSILSRFKEEDSPTRFGVKYSKKSTRVEGSFSFEATVSDEVKEAVVKKFTPQLNEEGDIVLPEEV